MKGKWKITIVWQDKTEIHDFEHYYEILHFVFDIIVFRITKQNIIIKIEYEEREKETSKEVSRIN